MTTTKLPKHWESMLDYRSYFRKFGPLTLKVVYSSSSDTFNATLYVPWNVEVKRLYREYKLDVGASDADMLRAFEYEAKREIRSWAK